MNIVRLLLVAGLLLLSPTARGLEAGAAKERIVPPPGATLDGDASRLGRAATGEHDPLWVRCLYLNDGTQAVFLVTADVFRISSSLRGQIVAKSGDFAAEEAIVLTATHTPNGPGGMSAGLVDRWYAGRWNPAMLEVLSDAAVKAMRAALESKRRATIGYGSARPRQLSINVLDAKGPVDDQVGVIRVDDADGSAIAIAACFSAAPMPAPESDRNRFSAGYAGVYYQKMEDMTEPGCVALLLMGAGGDQQPGNPENKSGWEHVESVGQLLALSAKAASNDMSFHDAGLNLSRREVFPPASLRSDLPGRTIIQTLEVDGLLLTFLPGMPTAGVGIELRRRALASGHKAQFTVGLANDYLGYIASPDAFAVPRSPAEMQAFGPDFASWIYEEAMSLAQEEAPAQNEPRLAEGAFESIPGGARILLRGSGMDRGYQRASAFRSEVQALYEERVASPARVGALHPAGDYWDLWPDLLDPSTIALPALGLSARPLLLDLPRTLFDEIEGFARGSELTFDGAWLLQNVGLLATAHGVPTLEAAPDGTMFAVLGALAAPGTPYLAVDIAWNSPGTPTISEIRPDEGHSYVQVGLDWQLGALAGLNDVGLALALERNDTLGTPELAGISARMLLRQVLQFAGTYEEALRILQSATRLRGYQIILVGPGDDGWRGATVRYGKRIESRSLSDGLLLGVDPDSENASPAAESRYRHLVIQMQGRENLTDEDTLDALRILDREPDVVSRGTLLLQPSARSFRAAFAIGDGTPGAFTELRLKEGVSHE